MIAAAALGDWQPRKGRALQADPTDKTRMMLG